ncbi:MAG: efflux RND transporter periplasmic adaptor subunit [SAR324 cluster bacterium]|nr:efflux RND transporter periplasmic adaptor subunit [SAR324 cluster bacterium]
MYNYLKNCKIIIGVFIIWPFFSLATSHGAELSGSFKTPISLTGIIEPAIILKVQPSVGGRVEVLHVKENQHVPKNQLLLTLNNDTQKRQLELTLLQHKVNENNVIDRKRQLKLANVQIKVDENNVKDRKNQLEVSRNNVKDLEANLKDILRRLKDEETLFEQGSSTRSQLDVLQLQYLKGEIALKNSILGLERAILNVDNTILSLERSREDIKGSEISVENALIAVERSRHDVELSEDALEDTLIKAKIGGIITAKSFQEGEVITAGAVLFQIIDIKQVEIKIQLGEGDLPMISEGQAVVFTTPGYRDIEFSGIIERISWTADPETGRFPLYVKAANPGLKLRAGMSAKVYLLRQK